MPVNSPSLNFLPRGNTTIIINNSVCFDPWKVGGGVKATVHFVAFGQNSKAIHFQFFLSKPTAV